MKNRPNPPEKLTGKALMYWMKYTILRRVIAYRYTTVLKPTICFSDVDSPHLNKEPIDLQGLAFEIEGKSIKELKEIHKKYLGY